MRKQLLDLRKVMKAHHIDAYMIPTTDFHDSEYVNDYFKCREYVSGFTGSAGTLIVTMEEAKLWTDGRYFIQAATQLSGSGIDLMKIGEPGVPTITEYLEKTLSKEQVLGFDGRVCTNGRTLAEKFNVSIDCDLVDEIWENRPPIIPSEIYALDEAVTGRSSESKLKCVRKYMEIKGADYHLTASLEEIAWLYNLRGSDVKHTPVFFAYALITPEEDRLYVMDKTFTGDNIYPYEQFLNDLRSLPAGSIVLNEKITSYAIMRALPADVKVINCENPVSIMKAVKNPIEIASTMNAHIKDGAAMVNFLHWLKTNIGKTKITEISAADYLESCRMQQDGCYDLSFETISGYGSNGAIIHYSATEDTNKELQPEGLYLVDSGGQYNDGTTDITRTVALGPLTDEMKLHYTAVLKGHIALSTAQFEPGTTGAELDALARKPIIDIGLNYNHGTGHGVGHLLACHEGPQTISPRGTVFPIEPGMINSNEPGIYIEGSHGIRLENEIICIKKSETLYGFESITFCPFDRDAIIVENLTDDELTWLNGYHRRIYETLTPMLSPEVLDWLRKETSELTR